MQLLPHLHSLYVHLIATTLPPIELQARAPMNCRCPDSPRLRARDDENRTMHTKAQMDAPDFSRVLYWLQDKVSTARWYRCKPD
jgi:hypothetical protein